MEFLRKRKKAAGSGINPLRAASNCIGQPLPLIAELDLLPGQFDQHRNSVLYGDALEFTVTNLSTELDKLTPTGRQCPDPVLTVVAIGNGWISVRHERRLRGYIRGKLR